MKRIVNLLIAAWVFVGLGLHAQTCLPDDVAYRVKSEGFANSQIEELAQFPDIPAELAPHLLRIRIASLITQGKLRQIVTNENTYYMLP